MRTAPKVKRRAWTAVDDAVIREMYPHRPTKEIAAFLRRQIGSVYQHAAQLGLHKAPEFLASPLSGVLYKGDTRKVGLAFRFKPGQVPHNKGLRRPGYAPGRMSETQFKKGHRAGVAAQKWRPIGTILPDAEGYLRIKVREAVHGQEAYGFGNTKVWPLLQRHVWEQHRGPIPEGHVIAFKDGKRDHCAIENLECISRADLARRNNIWRRYPRQLAEAIQLTGALKRKIRGKEKNGEK